MGGGGDFKLIDRIAFGAMLIVCFVVYLLEYVRVFRSEGANWCLILFFGWIICEGAGAYAVWKESFMCVVVFAVLFLVVVILDAIHHGSLACIVCGALAVAFAAMYAFLLK